LLGNVAERLGGALALMGTSPRRCRAHAA